MKFPWSDIKCHRCGIHPEETKREFYEIYLKSVWNFYETPERRLYLCEQCYRETEAVAHGGSAEYYDNYEKDFGKIVDPAFKAVAVETIVENIKGKAK